MRLRNVVVAVCLTAAAFATLERLSAQGSLTRD